MIRSGHTWKYIDGGEWRDLGGDLLLAPVYCQWTTWAAGECRPPPGHTCGRGTRSSHRERKERNVSNGTSPSPLCSRMESSTEECDVQCSPNIPGHVVVVVTAVLLVLVLGFGVALRYKMLSNSI